MLLFLLFFFLLLLLIVIGIDVVVVVVVVLKERPWACANKTNELWREVTQILSISIEKQTFNICISKSAICFLRIKLIWRAYAISYIVFHLDVCQYE